LPWSIWAMIEKFLMCCIKQEAQEIEFKRPAQKKGRVG